MSRTVSNVSRESSEGEARNDFCALLELAVDALYNIGGPDVPLHLHRAINDGEASLAIHLELGRGRPPSRFSPWSLDDWRN